jgi:hypothetical protein
LGTNTPSNNRTAQSVADQKLIDGLNKHAATITALVIAGASHTTSEIVARVQERVDAANTVNTTRATWRNAVKAETDGRTASRTFISGLKQALLVAFAGQINALADFGLTARKLRVLTPEQKTAAAAKAKATRAARHTMGKVQKSKITGASPAGVPVPPAPGPHPIPAGASPAPAPAPVAAPAAPVEPATATAPAAGPVQGVKS